MTEDSATKREESFPLLEEVMLVEFSDQGASPFSLCLCILDGLIVKSFGVGRDPGKSLLCACMKCLYLCIRSGDVGFDFV